MTINVQNDRPETLVEDDRTGMAPATLERAIIDHLNYSCSKTARAATLLDMYKALSLATRDRLVNRWLNTRNTYHKRDTKRIYYLSAEFLLGRLLRRNLVCLDIYEDIAKIFEDRGIDLEEIFEQEVDPGLGNGGLGRLAACFMDSMATLSLPGYGYGIRYEFGIFKQKIKDGQQIEQADAWLRYGNPWEQPRYEHTVTVNFYGREERYFDDQGQPHSQWVETEQVLGVPYDTPIAGYDNYTVNTLRLWAARATNDLNLSIFNDGDYRRAVEHKALSESISKVLYPKDTSLEGKELRLKQQYFFVCCALHDIIRRFSEHHDGFSEFPDKVAIQLNDTHPAICVAELMRILVDREGLKWNQAWQITQKTTAFTNHTLLAEALERWPVSMFERLLPRHLTIIYEINRRFLDDVHVFTGGDDAQIRRMSIIEEEPVKAVRMANLAVVCSHSINGVAELHSKLVKEQLLPDFFKLYPERFNNKTNGVTPRRWLLLCNPELSNAITARIGHGWVNQLTRLAELRPLADDPEFRQELRTIKHNNKLKMARIIKARNGIDVDPNSIFDVQIKRIHQYKRQLLNCMHIIALYQSIRRNPDLDVVPRTFIFGGKAAPGYAMAKLQIKLINDVANIVNSDPVVRDRIKVVFLSNYGVSLAERIIPATDLSEQISMAGKEASGTGNMKFAMNGALTIGTLDGANIEIREEVGADNFFLFGLKVDEVKALKARGYRPLDFIERHQQLKDVIALIDSGYFSRDDPERFAPIVHDLCHQDTYLLCADFADYIECQKKAALLYRDQEMWTRQVVHNISGTGKFSSDRTITQYAEEIWNVSPVAVSKP